MTVNQQTQEQGAEQREDLPFIWSISVAVPKSTKWKPNVVQQFVSGMYPITEPFKLIITATQHNIRWSIEAPYYFVQLIEKNINGIYPQAQIEIIPKETNHIGYWLYHLHGAVPFAAVLKYPEDFVDIDPMAIIAENMSTVDEGEEIVYELTLSPPTQNYAALGEKMLTKSAISGWEYTSLSGAMAATQAKAAGTDRVEVYAEEISRITRDKLASSLKEVILAIKVKAKSHDRADYLFAMTATSLDQYQKEKFNTIVEPGKGSYPLVLSAKEAAALWHLPSELCPNQRIVWGSQLASEIFEEPAVEYITLGTTPYMGQPQPVRLTYEDRVTHVYVVGKTRVGKSTLIHRMVHQDIAAGKGVAVIDPHGDLVGDILACSIPEERVQDVVLLDIRDQDYPIGLNLMAPVAGLSDEAVAGQALVVLKRLFDVEYWSTKIEDSLYAAIRPLVSYPGATVEDISRLFVNDQFRHHVLGRLGGEIDVGFWKEYEAMHPMVKNEVSNPITRRIRKFYRDPTIRRMVCQQSCLDLAHILNTGKIFLVNLGGGADISEIETYTIGALLISRLQLAAMSRVKLPRAERTPYYLYVDEVQNFVTTSLSKMFSEVGKYGLSLVVANQFLSQLQSATGDTLEAILGNVGTSIIFRVGTPDDKSLASHVEPNFTNQDLLNLDRFFTVVKMQAGGQTLDAFGMNTLTPLQPAEGVKDRVNRIRQHSRDTYARPASEVNEELKQRSQSSFEQSSQDSHNNTEEG